MNKNKYFNLIILIFTLLLVSCSNGEVIPDPEPENKYQITWANDNGDVLLVSDDVLEDTLPIYTGNIPTKAATNKETYKFIGWSPEISKATKNTTYTAVFEAVINKYTVTWQSEDGEVFRTDTDVLYGTIPSYEGLIPVKDGDSQFSYQFVSWMPEISALTSDVTYIAVFKEVINTYSVTWKNYDGTILKVDPSIPYGTTPVYTGSTPIREETVSMSYEFSRWSPEINIVTENIIYTAVFTETIKELPIENMPVISTDGKTVEYGFYPQKHVNDLNLIRELNQLVEPSANGWYLYEDSYYIKVIASPYSDQIKFDDGTKIVSGVEYWFECLPITWNILSTNDGTYYLLSEFLLDAGAFHSNYLNRNIDGQLIYANNYKYSNIRNWLNDNFFNQAFNLKNNYIVNESIDDDNNIITDKVYLLSDSDYVNEDYGFENNINEPSITRTSKTTDYARVRGAWVNTFDNAFLNNGSYWTRSANSEFTYAAFNVNTAGYLTKYAVDGIDHSIRPAITIELIK